VPGTNPFLRAEGYALSTEEQAGTEAFGIDEESEVWPERTAFGAAWRGAATLALTVIGMVVGAWLGSKLIPYDSRLVTGTTGPVTVIAGGMVIRWLRARNVWLLPTSLGTLTAAQMTSWFFHADAISLRSPYLLKETWPPVPVTVLAVSVAATVVGIVGATAAGYRNPRPLGEDTKRAA
jgi:hypothetical protein